jgi:hypothetical protein
VEFDGATHTYTLDGEKLLGVSTVAKIGQAEEAFGIASAWGFRLGVEGAHEVLVEWYDDGVPGTVDDLRAEVERRGLTPWSKRDRAADRGNWVHDMLEGLAQHGLVKPGGFAQGETEEVRGHVRAVLQWYLDYRPSFVATEVMVASEAHGFSGRYDARCLVSHARLAQGGYAVDCDAHYPNALLAIDLKTSKKIQPLSHYPQLAGYELASVEMGFPATDAQFVLNTHPDGTYSFQQSYATGEDFLAYLGAMRAIRRLQAEDPEVKIQRAREEEVLARLPGLSRDLRSDTGPLAGCDGKAIGILCSGLRKRGLVEQDERKVWRRV